VCPWCYIGKRRFEQALAAFPHADSVEVVWRSFELDAQAPAEPVGNYAVRLAEKYGCSLERAQEMLDTMTAAGAEDGLDLRFDIAVGGNTFDAHRLLHWAGERGLQGDLKERLLRATFHEGEPIGDRAALVRLAAEVGLDAVEASQVLSSDRYSAAVRSDQAQAQAYGISGVPFFVVDEKFGVSGAQPADVLRQVLEQAWADRPVQLVTTGAAAPGCDGDACST
jgi:predicted DsbA family dithiol-disulfide isomerase